MYFKKGGLLEQFSKSHPTEGVCETCKHLVQLSETALGCVAHDKLIMPQFPPYHGNCKCKDWKRKEAQQ